MFEEVVGSIKKNYTELNYAKVFFSHFFFWIDIYLRNKKIIIIITSCTQACKFGKGILFEIIKIDISQIFSQKKLQ